MSSVKMTQRTKEGRLVLLRVEPPNHHDNWTVNRQQLILVTWLGGGEPVDVYAVRDDAQPRPDLRNP